MHWAGTLEDVVSQVPHHRRCSIGLQTKLQPGKDVLQCGNGLSAPETISRCSGRFIKYRFLIAKVSSLPDQKTKKFIVFAWTCLEAWAVALFQAGVWGSFLLEMWMDPGSKYKATQTSASLVGSVFLPCNGTTGATAAVWGPTRIFLDHESN